MQMGVLAFVVDQDFSTMSSIQVCQGSRLYHLYRKGTHIRILREHFAQRRMYSRHYFMELQEFQLDFLEL